MTVFVFVDPPATATLGFAEAPHGKHRIVSVAADPPFPFGLGERWVSVPHAIDGGTSGALVHCALTALVMGGGQQKNGRVIVWIEVGGVLETDREAALPPMGPYFPQTVCHQETIAIPAGVHQVRAVMASRDGQTLELADIVFAGRQAA